jgi:putative spermidine/putrescine transport system permease protein
MISRVMSRAGLLRRPRTAEGVLAEVAAESDIPLIFKVISVITLIYLLVPAVIVVLAAVNSGNYLTFPPEGFSLKWVGKFLQEPYFRNAYLFSLGLALVTAFISTTLGSMAAIMLSRIRFRGRSFVRSFFLMPLMLPGVVLGLALYTFYISMKLPLSRTLGGMMVGHVILTMPYVMGTVSAALYNFDLSLEEAARSLGATPWQAFSKITMRMISSGIMAGFIFALIVSFGAFDISLFLSTPDLNPLPIAMYISLRYEFEPTAAAAGAFAIFLVIVSMLITSRLTDIGRFAGLKFS